MIPCREDGEALVFEVQVQPGARREGVLGVHDGALKVAVAARPERGKANRALVELLAGLFGVSRSQVTILKGEHRRRKVVRVAGGDSRVLRSVIAGRSNEG